MTASLHNRGPAQTPASPQFINCPGGFLPEQATSATQQLTAGLSAPAASVSPKYFYDALGSQLFEAITRLDEYYPTRTEAAIFDAADSEMTAAIVAR